MKNPRNPKSIPLNFLLVEASKKKNPFPCSVLFLIMFFTSSNLSSIIGFPFKKKDK